MLASPSLSIVVRKMKPTDAVQAARLITNVFIEREPIALRLKETVEETFPWAIDLARRSSNQNMSFVAEDLNRVMDARPMLVGVGLSEAFVPHPAPGAVDAADIWDVDYYEDPVSALLYGSEHTFLAQHYPDVLVSPQEASKFAYFSAAAVHSDYEGIGLCRKLANEVLLAAKLSGYKKIWVHCSALGTQHLFLNRLGFEVKFKVNYDDFKWRGVRPYAGLLDPQECWLLDRTL
ncbi:hypothetical protein K493DRAFT_389626 [Basidiobolus meristosporus CBS 931.73]|uniref:N-acetyltransferase domain-containing protein n=1 Tax=Basidiobolus meristosporus CBS 931.73 TaxID=1314790 RepID=A0A1Y1X5L5_9FUNG|nr:hypothetical protein K493DRAFT_389626 [Basidiobolus meristosporus CBS 931.73]|eukprot:ORX81099.1 hypothetical protein K493DRAFT_389626 [Basidiobolus meristosporus CBS 931.73]